MLTDNPVGYYRLGESSGIVAGDSSGGPDATKYTAANVPGTPTVGTPTTTSLVVTVDPNSNPSGTQYAITSDGGTTWVQFATTTSTTGTLGTGTTNIWSSATAVTITGLTCNTTYNFKVKARNGDNVETALNATAGSGTTGACCALNAPTAAAASGLTTDSITWNWGIAGNTCADGYRIYDAATSGTLKGTASGNATTTYTETALEPGTSCSRWVCAYSSTLGESTRTALAATSTTARNCPENGDFEDGWTSGVGNHWTKSGSYGTWAQSTSTKRDGTSSQQITDASGGNSFTDPIYQKLNVQASKNYTLRVWSYRATGTVLKVGVNLTGGTTEDASGQQSTAGTWLAKDLSFTSGATGMITVLLSAGYNSNDGVVYVDGVYLLPQKPSSTSADSATLCSGSSTNLNASGGWSGSSSELHWYTGPGGTGTAVGTGSPLSVSPTATTTYYARWEPTGWPSSPCLPSDDGTAVTVTVTALPTAPTSASVSPTTICAGDTGNITLTATGGSGDTLKWYSGSCGGTLVGTGTPLSIAKPGSTTTYYARWETALLRELDLRQRHADGEFLAGGSHGRQQQPGLRGRDSESDRLDDIGRHLQLDGTQRVYSERAKPDDHGRPDDAGRHL